MQLAYELAKGPSGSTRQRKRWDQVVCRLAVPTPVSAKTVRSTFDVQNEIIKRAIAGEYRPGHVIIK